MGLLCVGDAALQGWAGVDTCGRLFRMKAMNWMMSPKSKINTQNQDLSRGHFNLYQSQVPLASCDRLSHLNIGSVLGSTGIVEMYV